MLFFIVEVNIDETVEVDYVDYGNSETLSFEDLKKIPDMFIKIPIQVIILMALHYL